ncbi:MAG TPA: hypothetical protein VK533_01675 [Sphingomonas sp.]|uniref:hypothetical protein n=1 Tax=Sphingomonas sp. TaxID=28214 RepID=UPI002CF572CA|nr:hypothetical protein [Sphingomonas sp.]HMI18232.1 hypothetical protein [Sphingomonas sp.]
MNMVDFGYVVATALIVMIVVMRGYPLLRRFRPGPDNNWRNEAFVARELAQSWAENELSVGRADSAPVRYI